jgi:glutamate 5-kinase
MEPIKAPSKICTNGMGIGTGGMRTRDPLTTTASSMTRAKVIVSTPSPMIVLIEQNIRRTQLSPTNSSKTRLEGDALARSAANIDY